MEDLSGERLENTPARYVAWSLCDAEGRREADPSEADVAALGRFGSSFVMRLWRIVRELSALGGSSAVDNAEGNSPGGPSAASGSS